MIELVVVLSMFINEGDIKRLDGWYHQPTISVCLEAKRIAQRNSGIRVEYTCSLEKGIMVTDSTGVRHLDKIIK